MLRIKGSGNMLPDPSSSSSRSGNMLPDPLSRSSRSSWGTLGPYRYPLWGQIRLILTIIGKTFLGLEIKAYRTNFGFCLNWLG